jgi:undecaprenyl-diphosphatase
MIEQLNFALFHFINQYADLNPFIDYLAIITAKYMPVIIILSIAYIWIKNRDRTRDIILYGIYAAIIGLVINYIIGLVYFHPRPFMIPLGTLLFQYPAETSFPSDHATLMFSLAIMLIYFKETRIAGLIFLILGFIGGLARIFSGIHFPLDIFGSLLVSIISTILIFQFKDRFNLLNKEIKEIYDKIAGTGRK